MSNTNTVTIIITKTVPTAEIAKAVINKVKQSIPKNESVTVRTYSTEKTEETIA